MSRQSLAAFVTFGKKVVCVGRNYADHAAELNDAIPSVPLIFMKPPSCYVTKGQEVEIPLGTDELHHEIELGVVIGSQCRRASPEQALKSVGGYVLALDMTARDVQNELKKKGHPWELAKCFDTSLPVSDFIPLSSISDPHDVELVCEVNGELRQKESTSKMIYKIPDLLSYISDYFTLHEGDIVITGTPAGVGPVRHGDKIVGKIPGVVEMEFDVVQRQ